MGPGARSFSFRISHATRPVQDKILKGESFKALIEKHTAMGPNCGRQLFYLVFEAIKSSFRENFRLCCIRLLFFTVVRSSKKYGVEIPWAMRRFGFFRSRSLSHVKISLSKLQNDSVPKRRSGQR